MSGTGGQSFQDRVTDLLAGLGPYQMTELDQIGNVLISNVQDITARFDSGHVSAPERPGLNSELATNVALLAMLADNPPALLTTGAGAQASREFRVGSQDAQSREGNTAQTGADVQLDRQTAGIGPSGQGSQSAGVGTTDAPIENSPTGITVARAQNDGPGIATAEDRSSTANHPDASATETGTDQASVTHTDQDPPHAHDEHT